LERKSIKKHHVSFAFFFVLLFLLVNKEKKENKKERQICVITNVYYTLWIEVLASTKQPERDSNGSSSSIKN
jgi:hypothetical protein